MIRTRKTLFCLAATVAMSLVGSSAYAQNLDALFTPDLTEAVHAQDVTVTATAAAGMSLPVANPYNADMVDTENVAATGAGVYVAVLDTGMHPLAPFFFSQANVAWHLGKGYTHDITWDDDYGIMVGPLRDDRGIVTRLASSHGTHVASTVVGFNLNDSLWVKGIAPEATIIPVLVLDAWEVNTPYGPMQFSGGTDPMIAMGIYYVADLSETLDGPVVINMSLGGPERSPMIEAAIDYAIAKGVIVVVSAGNEGTTGMGYPGGLSQVISTGAVGWSSMFTQGWTGDVPEKLNSNDGIGNNRQLYLEDFSSRPNKDLDQKYQDLDVSAPGAWVVGPYQSAFSPDPYTGLSYYYLSGTSMAAPHVAAMAALVLERYPEVDQVDMESLLRNAATGNPLPANDAIVAYPFAEPWYYETTWGGGDSGKGFLQADAALRVASRRE